MPYISQEEYDAVLELLKNKEADQKLIQEQLDQVNKIKEYYIQYSKDLEDHYHKKEDELLELVIETEKFQDRIHENNIDIIRRYGKYNRIKAIVTIAIFLIGAPIILFIFLTKEGSIECSIRNLILTCIGIPTIVLSLTYFTYEHLINNVNGRTK
jgi:hypothetical protein